MKQNKKIVAIMFTSLVDYHQLAKKDNKLALELLSEHDKLLSSIIKKYQGRIIKHINDSIFAEFKSATDSTNCSIAIQRKIQKFNEINPKDFQKPYVFFGTDPKKCTFESFCIGNPYENGKF